MDERDKAITDSMRRTLRADLDLAQPVSVLMEACFAQAKIHDVPPEIMVASALSMCVTGCGLGGMNEDTLTGLASLLCDLRKHMRDAGLMVSVPVSPERNTATES